MTGYSVDLRERVVQSWQHGRAQTWIAREFRIGLATVKRYLQMYRVTGQLEPKVQQREQPIISDEQLVELQQQVDAQADANLEQHIEAWASTHGVRVSRSTMSRALARADRPLKKNGQRTRAR